MHNVFLIGVTGQTGAGKSEVVRIMARRGWFVLDADAFSREVVKPNTPCLAALVEHFSNAVLQPDGSLNRQALADLAFASPSETAALNAIVHPAVIQAMHEALEKAKPEVAVVDAPLLFQAGLETMCDCTVAVTAPADVRCRRICRRDGITEQQAAARMNAQPDEEYYRSRATVVLENAAGKAELEQAAELLCNRIEEWKSEQHKT